MSFFTRLTANKGRSERFVRINLLMMFWQTQANKTSRRPSTGPNSKKPANVPVYERDSSLDWTSS